MTAPRPKPLKAEAVATTVPGGLASYRSMLSIRRFEEKLGQLVALGVLQTTEPLCTGREAVAAGLAAGLPGDVPIAVSTGVYGMLLARGAGMERLCARALSAGTPEGVGAWRADGVHAAATAAEAHSFATAAARQGGTALCWIDGTRIDGFDVARALRDAREAGLALVLAISVPDTGEACQELFSDQTLTTVDGMDAKAVAAAAVRAVAATRSGQGVQALLVRTVPFRGHSVTRRPAGDSGREDWDPVARARARLIADGVAREADLKALERSVREEVNAAAASVRSGASPLFSAV